MQMQRLNIQLPKTLKAKLDAERKRGTSAAGLIRHLLEQHFKGKKGGVTHNQGGSFGASSASPWERVGLSLQSELTQRLSSGPVERHSCRTCVGENPPTKRAG